MTAGANDKKTVFGMPYNTGIAFLCGLGALCLYLFYTNVLAGPPGAPPDAGKTSSANTNLPPPTIPMPGSLPGAAPRRVASTSGRNEGFPPALHKKGQEGRAAPEGIDPTLRLDLLAKVQAVELAGGTRNLFQMGAPPKVEIAALKGTEPQVTLFKGPVAPPKDPGPPPAPPTPPIPLKFYGFSTVRSTGKKTAYFMDGEDILIASEGDMLKRRYRVVRILSNSVLMEDTESKRQQSVPLTEETQS
jgi:hypothetical protein